LLGILFTPEDGGDVFFGLPLIYTLLQPRRQYSSTIAVFNIVERSMSYEITEVNGIILSFKIVFKAVLEIILHKTN
jgi:hypothetical protein